MRLTAVLAVVCLVTSACNSDRIAQLEKDNQTLRQELKAAQQRAGSLELQGRCANDARGWFTREWSSDKDTLLLKYENHYSQALNKCIIKIFFNYRIGPQTDSFQRLTSLYDVYENKTLAEYSEYHMLVLNIPEKVLVGVCEVQGVTCSSFDDFTKRIAAFE